MVQRDGVALGDRRRALVPKSPRGFQKSVENPRKDIERAKAMGSPIVRVLLVSDRDNTPDDGVGLVSSVGADPIRGVIVSCSPHQSRNLIRTPKRASRLVQILE
jgi:hypothetical protein